MNKHIVVTGFIIAGGGVLTYYFGKEKATTLTRVIIGAFVLVIVLSILDMFGGPVSTLASALAMLAAVFVIVSTYLPVFQDLTSATQGKAPASTTAPGTF